MIFFKPANDGAQRALGSRFVCEFELYDREKGVMVDCGEEAFGFVGKGINRALCEAHWGFTKSCHQKADTASFSREDVIKAHMRHQAKGRKRR